VQIDFTSRTVRLLQRAELNEAGCESLTLSARNDALCARIAIDENAPQWLRLDTGCNTALEWVVTGHKAKNLSATTLGLNSGPVREIHTNVQLGGIHLSAVRTGIHTEQMFAGEAGLIGNGLLSQFPRHCGRRQVARVAWPKQLINLHRALRPDSPRSRKYQKSV
jgi:hypothetical protein